MRDWKIIFCTLIMSLLLGGTITYAAKYSNKDTVHNATPTYDSDMWITDNGEIEYPITTKDKKWKDFTSHEEMVNACTIPNELLEEMTTEELVELMMDYPLMSDLLLFDDIQAGFEVMSHDSNILGELQKREDGAEKLLTRYTEFKIKKYQKFPKK